MNSVKETVLKMSRRFTFKLCFFAYENVEHKTESVVVGKKKGCRVNVRFSVKWKLISQLGINKFDFECDATTK